MSSPDWRAVLLAPYDRAPLKTALDAFQCYPLRWCPRRSCGSAAIFVRAEVFACLECGLMSGGAAFAAGFLWDWTFDQVAEVLEVVRG